MILPTCIDPDHNQIVSHNGRKLEITLVLVTGMVDRNAAFMAKTCNFIVHSRVIGCCNNQKCLFQILFCKNGVSRSEVLSPQVPEPERFYIPRWIVDSCLIGLKTHYLPPVLPPSHPRQIPPKPWRAGLQSSRLLQSVSFSRADLQIAGNILYHIPFFAPCYCFRVLQTSVPRSHLTDHRSLRVALSTLHSQQLPEFYNRCPCSCCFLFQTAYSMPSTSACITATIPSAVYSAASA